MNTVPKQFQIPWEPPTHGCLKKWRKRIQAVIKRGKGFTLQQSRDADGWDACACGEAYQKFDGLTSDNIFCGPRDKYLADLGRQFAKYVKPMNPSQEWLKYHSGDHCKYRSGDPQKALQCLDRIESRLITIDKIFRREHKEALAEYVNSGVDTQLIDLFFEIGKDL